MTDVNREDPVVEEVKDDSDDEVPELEAAGTSAVTAPAADEPRVATRSEKKSRKAMAKLGLKPFEGVMKVTLKRSKTVSFVIDRPEVFYSGNTYVVFGMAKIDEVAGAKEAELMKAFQAAKAGMEAQAAEKTEGAEEEEGEEDAEGLEEKDIEVVMSQGGVSRAKAIKGLKAANGDVVNAIMSFNE